MSDRIYNAIFPPGILLFSEISHSSNWNQPRGYFFRSGWLGIKRRSTFSNYHLRPALELGLIEMNVVTSQTAASSSIGV